MTKSQQNEGLDLSEFDLLGAAQDDGIRVDIEHPTDPDKETGMWLIVAGPDSDRAQKAQRVSLDSRLKRGRRKPKVEEIENEAKKIMARRVISWGGFMLNGSSLECNFENAFMVLTKYPFVYEQVDMEANDRASFTQASQKSSATT